LVLALLGLLAILLAGIDATLGMFGLSLMTVRWSPALLLVLGLLFLSLEALPGNRDGS
jgi:hypothetical protein